MLNFKNHNLLNEIPLSRVRSHLVGNRPVVILTAFRGSNTYRDNVRSNRELAAVMKKNGYGFNFVDGHWVEIGSDDIDTKEDSLFVIGNENDSGRLKKLAISMMKRYHQDAIVYKDADTKNIVLIFNNGTEEKIGTFSPGKIGTAYTKLRGRSSGTFVFEGLREESNWISKHRSANG